MQSVSLKVVSSLTVTPVRRRTFGSKTKVIARKTAPDSLRSKPNRRWIVGIAQYGQMVSAHKSLQVKRWGVVTPKMGRGCHLKSSERTGRRAFNWIGMRRDVCAVIFVLEEFGRCYDLHMALDQWVGYYVLIRGHSLFMLGAIAWYCTIGTSD